jgi:hypothetical protein
MTGLADPSAFLCHYTRAETAFAHILPTRQLMLNPYAKMRDPFENRNPALRAAVRRGELTDVDDELFLRIEGEIGRRRDAMRLLSLTRGDVAPGSPTEQLFRCPWARPRMWEQYADNHAGACLIFDQTELLQALRHSLAARGSYWEGTVDYTVAGFGESRAAIVDLNKFHDWSLGDDAGMHVVQNHRDFFFLKTSDWASEFEYRFVFQEAVGMPDEPPTAAPAFFASYRDALRYVAVGENFPEWQLPGASETAREAGVELRRMTWKSGMPYPGRHVRPQN